MSSTFEYRAGRSITRRVNAATTDGSGVEGDRPNQDTLVRVESIVQHLASDGRWAQCGPTPGSGGPPAIRASRSESIIGGVPGT